jgi:hypothetical protein
VRRLTPDVLQVSRMSASSVDGIILRGGAGCTGEPLRQFRMILNRGAVNRLGPFVGRRMRPPLSARHGPNRIFEGNDCVISDAKLVSAQMNGLEQLDMAVR